MQVEFLVAVLAITCLTLLAYRAGKRCLLHRPRLDTRVFLGVVSIAFAFAWGYFGRLVWAERMPVSAALYWSNLTPVLLGFAAGLAGHAVGMRASVRPVISGVLMCLAIGYLIVPLARPHLFPLELGSQSVWRNGVCLQTHRSSCAPAAAVTLLGRHGIISTESELATMCLTSSMGTEPLGLYRGLAGIASFHGHEARVADSDPSEWLRRGQLPNVALVKFEPILGTSAANGFFGNPGERLGHSADGHAIAILGRTPAGRWLIGDPAVGRITWSDEELRKRFAGEAIYLRPAP